MNKKDTAFALSLLLRNQQLLLLFLFLLLPQLTIQAQPEFSDAELRLIRERKFLSDSLKHKLPQEKFPMPEISNQNGSLIVDGDIDATFNASVTEGFGYVNETVVQPDGKIIAVGLFQRANGARTNGIARFNADGTLDASFNSGTGANAAIRATALQSDGKIIIGGAFTSFNGQPVNRIVRLNSNGSVDSSFNFPTALGGQINDILILPDGKVLVGGAFNVSSTRLLRLNSNGTLDTSIAGFNSTVFTIASAPDGKILIGGQFSLPSPDVARLNSDGTFDSTFNPQSGSNGSVYKVIVQPNGKVLAGGAFTAFNGTATDGFVRLNDNGTVDTTFEITNDPQIQDLEVNGLALQPDGKILIGFFDNSTPFADVRRFNADGTPDSTFNTNSGNSLDVIDLNLLADGKVLAAGYFVSLNNQQRLRLVKLNSNGTLDTAFNPAVSTAGIVYAVKRQPDGKILIGGDFEYVNGVRKRAVARLNVDGTLDNTFNLGEGFYGDIYAIEIQPDGKIIIGGLFGGDSNFPGYAVARINSNGSFDVGLNFVERFVSVAFALALQIDGKILIGGQIFDQFAGTLPLAIRINSNGSLDTAFNAPNLPTPATGYVRSILVQSNNKIVVGGNFFPLGGGNFQRNGIARLNTDGSLDSAFSSFVGNVYSLKQQSDGKIYAGGFTLTRFSSEGVIDTTLNVGTGVNNLIRAVEIQPDGKILLGGFFTSYNGNPVNRIVRINNNGTIDGTFNAGTSGTVFALDLQPDGKILAGGQFLDFNNTEKFSLVRLQGSARLGGTPFDFDGDGKSDVSVFRPSNGSWYLLRSQAGFTSVELGVGTDLLAPADYDGDGKTDVAVFRPSNGGWYILRSSDGTVFSTQFGAVGDLPRPGDFDGDGKADVSVFRPASGQWFRINSSNNQFIGTAFGAQGDIPLIGDFDGDGKSDVSVFRPSNGGWYRLNSGNGQFVGTTFGTTGDVPAPADFDGDGKTDINVFRPSNGGWYRLNSSNNQFVGLQFGTANDVPVTADYDGDGKADVSVFRPSNGGWYRLNSANGSSSAVMFGANGDAPVPAAFVQ